MKLKQKIVAILLALAIFNLNLVLLPAQASEGCRCDHPHGEDGFVCFCGNSSLKPSCDSKGPSFSKGHCGLDKKSSDFSIPAHDYPSLLSGEGAGMYPHISFLNQIDNKAIPDVDMLPTERPPSIS